MAELLSKEGTRLTVEFSLFEDPVKMARKIGEDEFMAWLAGIPCAKDVKALCEDLLTKNVYQIQETNLCQGEDKEKICTIIAFDDRVYIASRHSRRNIMPLPIARFYLGDQSVLRLNAETEVAVLFG